MDKSYPPSLDETKNVLDNDTGGIGPVGHEHLLSSTTEGALGPDESQPGLSQWTLLLISGTIE